MISGHVLSASTIKHPMSSPGLVIHLQRGSNLFRYPNFLGSLNVSNHISDQDFWHPNGILFSTIYRNPNKFCTNATFRIFKKNISRIKGYNFLVCAILLIMAYTLELLTIRPSNFLQKCGLSSIEGLLAFLWNVPKILRIQGELLA